MNKYKFKLRLNKLKIKMKENNQFDNQIIINFLI